MMAWLVIAALVWLLIPVPIAVGGESHLGFAIQLGTIKTFLAEACYAALYDDKAPAPEQCLADRAAAAAAKKKAVVE